MDISWQMGSEIAGEKSSSSPSVNRLLSPVSLWSDGMQVHARPPTSPDLGMANFISSNFMIGSSVPNLNSHTIPIIQTTPNIH